MAYLTFEPENGRKLSYQRRGSGPLVVCVPGGPGMDPEAYFAALDLPGHLLAGAQAVDAPALAIGCEFDVTVPAAAMHLIAEALPNGHFFELAGAGHFPEVEAPAEFRAAVTAFLAGRPVAGVA